MPGVGAFGGELKVRLDGGGVVAFVQHPDGGGERAVEGAEDAFAGGGVGEVLLLGGTNPHLCIRPPLISLDLQSL